MTLSASDSRVQPSSYQVLARKYRPMFFRDVVGQDVFVRMIQNGLRYGRMAHGFLMTGMRGIGKTTLARLLAKALCCEKISSESECVEPCGVCVSCCSMQEDRHLDIMEFDAASHTGIDDIRFLSESAGYRPVMGGAYRIFIIDEVHMLSKNAFNALLKTLEDPPSHVKFILATTEMQKVPLTIVSRCQHVDLKPLSVESLQGLLQKICTMEGITAEKDVLSTLAVYAEGGARDVLSLLERVILSTEHHGTISMQDVRRLLGLSSQEALLQLVEKIVALDAEGVLFHKRAMEEQGEEPRMILLGLLDVLYHLMLHLMQLSSPHGSLLDFSSLMGKIDVGHVSRLWSLFYKSLYDVQHAPFPFMALEMVLLRGVYMGKFPTPGELLHQWNAQQHASSGDMSSESSSVVDHPLLKKALELFPGAKVES